MCSTGTSNNNIIITNVGSRYTKPFFDYGNVDYYVNPIFTATTDLALYGINEYVNQTLPSSGLTNDLIPQLSSQTCDLSSSMVYDTFLYGSPTNPNYNRYLYQYSVVVIDPSVNLQDIHIYFSPIDSFGAYLGYPSPIPTYSDLGLTYSGGSITYANPSYTV